MATMKDRIKQKRKECGLTQEELGLKLGVNKQAVCKWENGNVSNIKRSTIEEMARIFGVSPSWLMGFDSRSEVRLAEEITADAKIPVNNFNTVTDLLVSMRNMPQEDISVLIEAIQKPEIRKELMCYAAFMLERRNK